MPGVCDIAREAVLGVKQVGRRGARAESQEKASFGANLVRVMERLIRPQQ